MIKVRWWSLGWALSGVLLMVVPAWAVCESSFQESGHDLELTMIDLVPEGNDEGTASNDESILHLLAAIWNCGPDKTPVKIQLRYQLHERNHPESEPVKLLTAFSDPVGGDEGQIIYSRIVLPPFVTPGEYYLSGSIFHEESFQSEDLNPENDFKWLALEILEEGDSKENPPSREEEKNHADDEGRVNVASRFISPY